MAGLLHRESQFSQDSAISLKKYIKEIQECDVKDAANDDIASLDNEIEILEIQLAKIKVEKSSLRQKKTKLATELYEAQIVRDSMINRNNCLEYEINQVVENIQSVQSELACTESTLTKNKQINIMNDAFYIWFSGPFATINSLRLGNLPYKPIDFTEINAALGQAALAVHIVSSRAGIEFKSFVILPMGSFPKILKADDRRTSYPLFIDSSSSFYLSSQSMFPKRYFNLALTGFMTCIFEVGEYISNHDPTLSLPYRIVIADSKISEVSFTYGVDEEVWTRALKFMLSNIKWIIAWYAKHCTHAGAFSVAGNQN